MTTPPDQLNAIGVLKRREIEARILAPFVEALSEKFDRQEVLEVLRETIIEVARRQGAELAKRMPDNGLESFSDTLPAWTKDEALEIEVLEKDPGRFAFNVTRCRYAEMYRALGIPELGALLSCNRDFSLIEGFNPEVKLTREQTILQGASCCDFRYRFEER
jgi:predicted ArsR family transcriptional regulator